jgi:polysaccharide deacetylase 2 family uncharacterized protein YibQ
MAKKNSSKGFILTVALVFLGVIVGVASAVFLFIYVLPDKSGPKEPLTKLSKHIPEELPKIARPEEENIPLPHIKPRVAIVIDDMGADLKRMRELFDVDAQITVAVLPYLRHSKKVATEAHNSRGWEVILHLPMEPKGFDAGETGKNPGKGALFTNMSVADIKAQVEDDIKDVPFADGINNHMGSRFTEDTALMKVVLGVAKGHRLFFLDSRTTADSVAGKAAQAMGVKSAERAVFLDNTRDVDYVKKQVAELVSVAKHKGSAIAIGHPYPETIIALKESVGYLKENGIEVVRLSELVK